MTARPVSEPRIAASEHPKDQGATFRGTMGRILLVFGGNAGAMLLGLAANLWAMRALGPEQYAVVAVSLVVLFVAWQFTGKGFDQSAVRLAAITESKSGPAAIFETVYALKLIGNVVLLVVGLALAGPLARSVFAFEPGRAEWPVGLAFVGAAAASMWGYQSAAIQSESRFARFTTVQVANNFIKLLVIGGIVLLAVLTPSNVMVATAIGFGAAAGIGMALAPKYAKRPKLHAGETRHILRYSRWLIISSVLFLLYSRLDIVMLKRLADDRTVGVYGAAALVMQMADLLAASILTVFLPRFSRYTEAAPLREQVKSSLRCSILVVAPLIPCYFLIEPGMGLLLLIVGEAYSGCIVYLKLMYFGVLFTMLTHPLHILFYARGRPHVLTLLDSFMLLFIAFGHYFAITRYGAIGAAGVVLISRIVAGTLLSVGVLSELSSKGEPRGGPS